MTETPPAGRRKLPARYHRFVMPLVLATLMSLIVSGIATIKTIGLAPGFAGEWAGAWIASLVVAYPTLLLVLPIVRRIVGLIVETPPGG